MQFQVPQFIETEDKIVGPFSLRQFLYFAAAGGLTFLLYFTIQLWLTVILGIFFIAIAFALAFVKIGGRSLNHVIGSALHYYWQPQTYVWQAIKPGVDKQAAMKQPLGKSGMTLEDVVTGAALQSTWQGLQTGSKMSDRQFLGNPNERYQVYQRLTGDREAARRVDYR